MKMRFFSFVLVSALSLTLFTVLGSNDALSANPKSVVFPEEVAAVMSSQGYSTLFRRVRQSLSAGSLLQASSARVEKIGNQTYTYISLKRINPHDPVMPQSAYGEIVGEIQYGRDREVVVQRTYFKPPADSASLPKY